MSVKSRIPSKFAPLVVPCQNPQDVVYYRYREVPLRDG